MGEGGGEDVPVDVFFHPPLNPLPSMEGKYTGFLMLQTMSATLVYRTGTESPIVNSISASPATSMRA